MIAVSMDLAVENGKKYHQRSEALHSSELTMWHSRFKFADKNSREPEGNLALTQRERERNTKRNVWLSESRDQDYFKARIKYAAYKPFRKKRQSLHAIVPQIDQDECLGALSAVEDGDPCSVGMILDVWGHSCLFTWILGTVLLKYWRSAPCCKVCQSWWNQAEVVCH